MTRVWGMTVGYPSSRQWAVQGTLAKKVLPTFLITLTYQKSVNESSSVLLVFLISKLFAQNVLSEKKFSTDQSHKNHREFSYPTK